jgi:signal transduction histidine kinase/CheY-like chemotaxis protein
VSPASTPPTPLARWLTSHPRAAALGQNAAVALGMWLAGALTWEAIAPGGTPAIWPPAGLALAAVWYGGARVWPGVALGALAVAAAHGSIGAALAAGAGAVLGAFVNVRLLRAWQFDARLERVRDPLVLAFGAPPAGSLVTATIGAAALWLFGDVPTSGAAFAWLLWWLRDWVGALVFSALVFTWTESRPIQWTRSRVIESAVLALTLLVASQLIFGLWGVFAARDVPIAFVFFPIVGWASLRLGPRGASSVVALMALFAIPIAGLGIGPFASFPLPFTVFLLFVFLTTGSVSGQVLAAVIAERDDALQKRIQLEEQLRHAQKMEAVGRLAGGIAHDFNNLLTAIIGYTEIVLTALDPKDQLRADAEEIGRAALRAADLTRQMLAFSRRQVLQLRNVDLNRALTKVEPMLRRLIGEDIVLTVDRRATSPLVRVDPGQIEQVIVNLVVNARDAMPKGGRVTVETSDVVIEPGTTLDNPDARPGTFVALSVTDTGIGMPATVRARIFEPYFTTKDVGKGTGLGLSTAYGIVRQSDGHINVISEVGLGSTFRVMLPRAEVEAKPDTDSTVKRLPGGSEHILIVEDDASVRHLAKDLLTRLGYSITEAASGRAGLALGSDDTRHFDLALCDVILGDMSGPAVAEALQALRPSIRVLFMSGYTDDAIVRTGVLDEGKPFLQKPFTPIQLARKIREVLEDREAGVA